MSTHLKTETLKDEPVIFIFRCSSAESLNLSGACNHFRMTSSRVSPHLTLHQSSQKPSRNRCLVLFFPFLGASQKALDEYQKLYLCRGLSVLTVNTQLKHFLWPSLGKDLASELLKYLTSEQAPPEVECYFVHTMSIGAFMYTIVMHEILGKHQYSPIGNKIVGQVFDSLTMGGLEQMIRGIVTKFSGSVKQYAVSASIRTYFCLTKRHTVDLYDKYVDFFKTAPLPTPVLVYYALNDPLLCPIAMREMLTKWRDMKDSSLDISEVCWESSKHAYHIREHPEEYKTALKAFLVKLGLDAVQSKL